MGCDYQKNVEHCQSHPFYQWCFDFLRWNFGQRCSLQHSQDTFDLFCDLVPGFVGFWSVDPRQCLIFIYFFSHHFQCLSLTVMKHTNHDSHFPSKLWMDCLGCFNAAGAFLFATIVV